MKEIFSCYKSEGTKLIEILNRKKDEGYVVRDLEFDGGLLSATFESYDKDFVYSIDYSNLYNNSISNENEYFDIARLNGWKLQFITEGMGIWINDDVENAAPFPLIIAYAFGASLYNILIISNVFIIFLQYLIYEDH